MHVSVLQKYVRQPSGRVAAYNTGQYEKAPKISRASSSSN